MRLYYNYGALLEKAEQIRQGLPDMLEAGNWDGIRELLAISEEIWVGPSADSYRNIVKTVLEKRDNNAREVIVMLPDTIESDVKHMQKTDRRAAECDFQNFAQPFRNW